MEKISDIAKFARLIPLDIHGFIHQLRDLEEACKNAGNNFTLLELAIFLHDHRISFNHRMYVETGNIAHLWSCLSDLSGVAAGYFYLSKSPQDKTFLKPLPDWLLTHVAMSATKLHSLILKAEIHSMTFIKSPHSKNIKSKEFIDIQEPSDRRDDFIKERKAFNKKIQNQIPQALKLIRQGRNGIILAGTERKLLQENANFLVEDEDPITAAKAARNLRLQSVISDQSRIPEVEIELDMQHANKNMRKNHRILGLQDKKRRKKLFPTE
jgi:hypothetical protein